MLFFLKKNCARTVINQVGGINTTDTLLTVLNASDFPTTGDFLVTVWNKLSFTDPCDDPNYEIIKVTGVSGNDFTIERGLENTTGKDHANGRAVEMLITAGTFEEIESAITSALEVPVVGEDLTSQINGITDIFTISNAYITDTTAVYVGGQRLRRGSGYLEVTSTTIRILGDILLAGEKIIIDYHK